MGGKPKCHCGSSSEKTKHNPKLTCNINDKECWRKRKTSGHTSDRKRRDEKSQAKQEKHTNKRKFSGDGDETLQGNKRRSTSETFKSAVTERGIDLFKTQHNGNYGQFVGFTETSIINNERSLDRLHSSEQMKQKANSKMTVQEVCLPEKEKHTDCMTIYRQTNQHVPQNDEQQLSNYENNGETELWSITSHIAMENFDSIMSSFEILLLDLENLLDPPIKLQICRKQKRQKTVYCHLQKRGQRKIPTTSSRDIKNHVTNNNGIIQASSFAVNIIETSSKYREEIIVSLLHTCDFRQTQSVDILACLNSQCRLPKLYRMNHLKEPLLVFNKYQSDKGSPNLNETKFNNAVFQSVTLLQIPRKISNSNTYIRAHKGEIRQKRLQRIECKYSPSKVLIGVSLCTVTDDDVDTLSSMQDKISTTDNKFGQLCQISSSKTDSISLRADTMPDRFSDEQEIQVRSKLNVSVGGKNMKLLPILSNVRNSNKDNSVLNLKVMTEKSQMPSQSIEIPIEKPLYEVTDVGVDKLLSIQDKTSIHLSDGDKLNEQLSIIITDSIDSITLQEDKTPVRVSDDDESLEIQLQSKTNVTIEGQGVTFFQIPKKTFKSYRRDCVLDLSHKSETIRQRRLQDHENNYNLDKNIKSNCDANYDPKDSYVEIIRGITWLSMDELPVPDVELDIGYVEFEPMTTIIDQLARDENPGPHITMRYELLRFCTLRNYPKHDKPYLIRISGAGFYYAAEGDELVCYCCGMRKRGWTESDKPMEIHRRLAPSCSFLMRNDDVNVPVRTPEGRPEVDRFAFLNDPTPTENSRAETTESNSSSSTIERVSSPGVNNETPQEDSMSIPVYQELNRSDVNSSSATPERHQRRHGNFSFCNNSSTEIATTTSNSCAPQSAAATRNPQPKHPNYAPRSVRVASFQGWPDDLTQTPEVLADAGFYYAGIADCVRCYFCGLGLRHWSEEDNPWIEHARWSRPCLYVKMIKGEEFINLVHLAVQYTENERTQNEEQQTATASGETNTEHEGRQIPIDEINRLLLTDAAQSVLDMGYQPDIIKKAIEKVLIRDGRSGISSTNIMAMIFEIEENEAEAALTNRVSNIEISSNDNSSSNANEVVAHSTVNTSSANALNTTSNSNETRQRNRLSNLPTNTNAVAASAMAIANTNASLTNSRTETPPSKTNTNRKDAKTVKKENERMKMQTMCQICKNNSVAIVFLPCGHLVTCETCAPTLRNCPMSDCDKIVKGTVKAFMA